MIKEHILVARRGDCKFVEKLQLAYENNAKAVVVVNSADTERLYMAAPEGQLAAPIPMVIMAKSDGDKLINAIIENKHSGGDPIVGQLYESNQEQVKLYSHSNLYASGVNGNMFTVALKDVSYSYSATTDSTDRQGYVDVHKVSSVEGTYIANYVAFSGTESTIITHNKGNHWHPLYIGENRLHIALESANVNSGIPEPVSSDTSVGIILANGWEQPPDMDRPPSPDAKTAKAYLSRDGGTEWTAVDPVRGRLTPLVDHR